MFTATNHRRPLVLVAEDDRDTRELYRACFDTSGYRTGEAATGSQAIAVAIELLPDVLLTDYMLPDVDGITISRRLKQDARTDAIRILMVTAFATPDLDRRAGAAGIERVLLKPCLPQAALREVARTLARAVPPSAQSTRSVGPQPQPQPRPRPRIDDRSTSTFESDVSRIREEFATLPGLALTPEQARLVFDLDRPTVERILDTLIVEGFLTRTPQGAFRRPH